jgi:hypothetical protein
VWGTSSGSYPNEVGATSNAYARSTWPRGTTVYYKSKIINTSCAVQFNGTVNANGNSTNVTFEYGTTSGVYPSSVAATPSPVTGASNTSVSATVSSLAAGTYYFRVKAVNTSGTTYGTQQSIAISSKSATAASEQSFTPPAVTQIQNILVVGGGSGRGFYDLNGGGGGGVTHKASASVGDSVSITTGYGSTGNNPGGQSQLVCTGATMTANGGGTYVSNPYPTPGRAPSSGSASGGDTNYASSQGGQSYVYWNENTTAGGGGGGAGGAGGDLGLCRTDPNNPYGGNYSDVGGAGGSHVNIFGFLVGGGGGGASDTGTAGNGPCGDLQGADGGGTYGKGARAYVTGTQGNGSGEPNIVYNNSPSSMSGTDGIVTFEWVGPA